MLKPNRKPAGTGIDTVRPRPVQPPRRRVFNYSKTQVQPASRRRRWWHWPVVAAVILAVAAGAYKFLPAKTVSQVSQAVTSVVPAVVIPPKPADNNTEMAAMQTAVQAIIDASPSITVGVRVVDLKFNTNATIGSAGTFLGASTTKLLTAATFLSEVEQGKQTLDEKLDGYPASWHLEQMINQSNNDSWASLIAAVSYQHLGAYAAKIGMTGYDYNDNSLTVNDEAILLQKLYQGQLLNKAHTDLVLGYMQNTNNEMMIPTAIAGSGITAYHKYGQYSGYLHDVGILIKGDHPVVLVVYTKSSTGGYAGTTEVIQQLVQAVTTNLYTP